MVNFSPLQLRTAETGKILPLGTYEPDTYLVPISPSGNSILSSLLVLSLTPGASVTVNYFQTTSANEQEERTVMMGHLPVTVASLSADQILVTRIHNKVYAEIIVAGGPCRIGLFGTVVSSVASDIDSALKRDGQVANLLVDKGIPVLGLDDDGTFKILPFVDGRIPVEATIVIATGAPVSVSGATSSVPTGLQVDVLSYLVPVGKRLTIHRLDFGGNNIARYSAVADALAIDQSWTWFSGPLWGCFDFGPSGARFAAGVTVKVQAIHSRPNPGDFSARLSGILENA